jgi:hypothetical protein
MNPEGQMMPEPEPDEPSGNDAAAQRKPDDLAGGMVPAGGDYLTQDDLDAILAASEGKTQPQPETADGIGSFVDSLTQDLPRISPLHGLSVYSHAQEIVGDSPDAFLATLYWQQILNSGAIAESVSHHTAGHGRLLRDDCIVSPRGNGANISRHDLLVLVDANVLSEPRRELLAGKRHENEKTFSWAHYAGFLDTRRNRQSLAASRFVIAAQELRRHLGDEGTWARSFEDLHEIMRPSWVIAPKPDLMWTAKAGPMAVSTTPGGAATSTGGVFTEDRQGRYGVTVSAHAVRAVGAAGPIPGQFVEVDGLAGFVASVDLVCDTAFVELKETPRHAFQPVKGPLSNVTPRKGESARFTNLMKELKTATVKEWCPDVPLVVPGVQPRVFTTPCTVQGDSGAALVDGDDKALGFAIYRTGANSYMQFSAWVWADSVWSALDLV